MTVAARRVLDGMRAHWRAAARGLPRRQALIELPRQRFDAVEQRLGTRAGGECPRSTSGAWSRVASRLAPSLLHRRIGRARDRLEALGRRAAASLQRADRTAADAAGARCRTPQPAGRAPAGGAVQGARRDLVAADCGNPCSTQWAGTGAISTLPPSCSPRSATMASCSADLPWCATARATACARRHRLTQASTSTSSWPMATSGRKRATMPASRTSQGRHRAAAPARRRLARQGGSQGSLF